ncbi:hypothetical protein MLD38_039039 [Melastoma candidum]|uniref:Uncharacterized protein n=1 Tax=Melastoma candidum TaxID=119954 RepID=A0ACB9L142_9MYRT|nr:hypothetical protein MLD38_039039 [Melastoma candidum]
MLGHPAAGAALLVNPLNVAKFRWSQTRFQAQAAGFLPKGVCSRPSLDMLRTGEVIHVVHEEAVFWPEGVRYKGTLDVFYEIIRPEGVSRLWRDTYASLALAVPTVEYIFHAMMSSEMP